MDQVEKELLAVTEGIKKSEKGYSIDFEKNSPEDLIEAVTPQLYKSEVLNQTYWFGYKFKSTADSVERTKLLRWLKGLSEDKPSELQLRQLIERPLGFLNKTTPLSNFGCVIYPRSQRSNLTKEIINAIGKYFQPTTEYKSFELLKSVPQDIEFNWEYFNADYEGEIGDKRYLQIKSYVVNTLLPKIKSLDYFSIAESVKAKYRKYLWKYLIPESDELKEVLASLQGDKVLVVDDINTTGATLSEILKVIGMLNPQVEIYIFTLIGRE